MRQYVKADLVTALTSVRFKDLGGFLFALSLPNDNGMRLLDTSRIAKCRLLAISLIYFALPAIATAETRTSAWPASNAADSTGKPAGSRLGIQSDAKPGTSSSFKSNSSQRRKSLGKIMAPASGNDAAYIAFDQGQYITAKRIAEERVKQNDPQAHTLLGRIYAEGAGVPRDELKAAQWYQKGAELGDTEAMFALGVILASGTAVKKDHDGAAQMFEQAARRGHAFAHYNLALLFLSGQGKPENPYRAAQHLEYAAQKGIPQAQYDLATLYQRGYGVEPDAYKAAFWLQKAANKGMPTAQFEYAVVLLRGQGLNKDRPKITEYLISAASSGIAGAQNRLAHLYHAGIPGVSRNPLLAAKWRWLAKQNGIKDKALDAIIAKYPKKLLREAEILARDQQAQALVGVSRRAQ